MIGIRGVELTEIAGHTDDRGSFVEVCRASHGVIAFSQINHSHSREGALRGLHYHQRQSDLWYIVSGSAQVALADLRDRSGDLSISVFEMHANRPSTLLIPPGVAHGYLALTELHLVYAVNEEYDGGDEFGISWCDATLQIPWATQNPVLSERDQMNPELRWESIPSFS